MVNIEFTKEQFESLLKLAYLGELMVNGHRIEDNVVEFQELEQYLYSKASLFGLDHLVVVEPDSDAVLPSMELEMDDDIQEYIDEYDNETFWAELCDRLAERDALKIHGEEKLASMDVMERYNILTGLEDQYREKFINEGLDII